MPVSAIGNIIIVNQQMHIASNASSNLQNRFDLQNLAAMIKANEKEEIKNVRPMEEPHMIDPEKEQEKERVKKEENQRQKNQQKHSFKGKKKENSGNEILNNSHILDLKG